MKPKPPPTDEIKRRKGLILSCSKCDLSIPVIAWEDPHQGDGWPQHKCKADYTIRPFDCSEPDPRATQSKGAPFQG